MKLALWLKRQLVSQPMRLPTRTVILMDMVGNYLSQKV